MIDLPPPIPSTPTEKTLHSRLGVASFIVSIVIALAILALFVIAGSLARRAPGAPYPGQQLVGMIAILLLVCDVVAVGLGIAGICQTNVKKVFAILGTVFSVCTILGTIALIAIGLAYSSRLHS